VAGYLKRMDRQRLQSASTSVVGELKAARMEAIAKSVRVAVTLPVSGVYLRKEADEDGDGSISAGERTDVEIQNADGVVITTAGGGAGFAGSGLFTAGSTPWEIQVASSSAGSKYIYVFGSGHVEEYDQQMSF
jgi:Tfp pilus assembly protein FimT